MSRGAPDPEHLTPRMIVAELDRRVVGQGDAKRAVAVAMRNRWRRQRVPEHLRDDISPKNIIMVGPTGVGKTEIARRLARLCGAPFLKVEVSKFTEVGYVGRDVESIVRDLVEMGAGLVREELMAEVQGEARRQADARILELLLPGSEGKPGYTDRPGQAPTPSPRTREKLRELLDAGKLDGREIEIQVEESGGGVQAIPMGGAMNEQLGRQIEELFGKLGRRSRTRKTTVAEARKILTEQEAARLLDQDRVAREAVRRTEQLGVVFLDEIDKICRRENVRGGDVSREGVQRDLLPLVEGTQVSTRYGVVRTDHILFIAAGAFHLSKVSDLIPELQGRFPIRVELSALGAEDFVRILTEPDGSLLEQYVALMATEGVELEFDDDAVQALAQAAARANAALENIGARRLHTVLERVLEELSFEASELGARPVRITRGYVEERLDPVLRDQELSRHIL